MRCADRLFQIVQCLHGGRLVTAAALARQLEVSPRTIYRDIADLQSTGVPIDGEAGVGYVMGAGFDLPPLMFTQDEVAALVAGARMVRAFAGADMARAASEALIKIEAVLPESARARAARVPVHAMAPDLTPELQRDIDRLQAATDGGLSLEIAYEDANGTTTRRRLRPLGLWFWGTVWTLVGWCELRDAFRTFRIDRIAEITEGPPVRPERGKTLRDFYRQIESEDFHKS